MCLICIAMLLSCKGQARELTALEEGVVEAVGIDRNIVISIASHGGPIERMMATTVDYRQEPADGVVLSTRPSRGRDVLRELRSEFNGSGYWAYLLDESFGHGPDKVAIVKVKDDYKYLGLVRTDGVNLDLEHATILARYRSWDSKYALRLVGAGQDWLEAELANPPSDWGAFADEVYEFCPDVVDQGTGDVESLANEMSAARTVYLWWD